MNNTQVLKDFFKTLTKEELSEYTRDKDTSCRRIVNEYGKISTDNISLNGCYWNDDENNEQCDKCNALKREIANEVYNERTEGKEVKEMETTIINDTELKRYFNTLEKCELELYSCNSFVCDELLNRNGTFEPINYDITCDFNDGDCANCRKHIIKVAKEIYDNKTKTKRNYNLSKIKINDTLILSEIDNVIAILEENTDKIDGVPKFNNDIEIIQANDNYMIKDIDTNKFYLLETDKHITEVYPLKTFGGFKMYTLEELKEMTTIDFLEYDEQTQAYIKAIIERTNVLGKVKGLM